MDKEPENKLPPNFNQQGEDIEHPGDIHEENNNEDNLKNENEQEKIEKNEKQEYLEKKIENYNLKITNNTAKLIENAMNDIEEDFKQNKINLSDNSRNLNKLIEQYENKEKNLDNFTLNDQKNILKKKNLQKLKNLKLDKDNLLKKIQKLDSQKKLIEDEGMLNLNEVDKNLKNEELKKINKDLTQNNEKINQIEYNMKNILAEESGLSKDEKLKEFINNFERDKEIIEIKSKEYLKKYKEKKKEYKKKEDKIKEIEKKEKQKIFEYEKKQNEIILDKAKERQIKEKEKREQIKKLIEDKEKDTLEKLKKLQEEKKFEDHSNMKEKDYLYNKYEDNYIKNQKKKMMGILSERKKKYHSLIKQEDLKDFRKEMKKKLKEQEKKHEEDKKTLIEEWRSRNKNLPKFKTSIFQTYEIENKKIRELEEFKLLNRKKSYEKKLLYSKNNIIRPEESEKLKKIREDNILNLSEKTRIKKDNNNKQKKNYLINNELLKNYKYNYELKLDDIDINNPLGTSVLIQKAIKKKPKKLLYPDGKKLIVKPKKKINYLDEFTKDKNINDNNKINGEELSKKWEKIIHNKKSPLKENIQKVQNQANYLEQKAYENENALRINGGIEKNPNLGKKVSSLLIDSIHAKLSIIDSLENN